MTIPAETPVPMGTKTRSSSPRPAPRRHSAKVPARTSWPKPTGNPVARSTRDRTGTSGQPTPVVADAGDHQPDAVAAGVPWRRRWELVDRGQDRGQDLAGPAVAGGRRPAQPGHDPSVAVDHRSLDRRPADV